MDISILILIACVIIIILAAVILSKMDKKKCESFKARMNPVWGGAGGKWMSGSVADCQAQMNSQTYGDPQNAPGFYCDGLGLVDPTGDTVCPQGSAMALIPSQCSNPIIAGDPNTPMAGNLCCQTSDCSNNYPVAINNCNCNTTSDIAALNMPGLGVCQ